MASSSTGRISAIDALRGLAILGMVFSGTEAWNAGLPAWMFHCQVPPPDFNFDPSIKGITWVDLVFPFFLFSLGAALPFSLGGRLAKGQSVWQVICTILKRWVIIAAFGIALGNSGQMYWGAPDAPEWARQVLRVLIWAGFYMALVRIKNPSKALIVNLSGLVLVIADLLVGHLVFKAPFGVHSNDIIIMVMSSMVLFGGLAWLATRKSIGWRLAIWGVCVALKAVRSYVPGTADMLELPECINWLFNWRYMQYLGIVLPASVVGDLLAKRAPTAHDDARRAIASLLAFAMIPVGLWGFFSRNVLALAVIVAASAIVYVLLTSKSADTRTAIGRIGFALLLIGIALDPADGGITKDHCNLSYLFATGGMAALITSFFMWLENNFGAPGYVLPRLGQNPMIAYTVAGYLIIPLFGVVGLGSWLAGMSEGNQFWGIMHGVVYTGLMALVTIIFTNKKIYWRS